MPKILNRARLRRKLKALPEEVKRQIRPALERGAQEIADLAVHLAPVDTGALRNSIDWAYGDPPDSAVLAGGKSGPPAQVSDLRISVYAGNELAFYARWKEFGTRLEPAHPFFFVAYRALRKRVASGIKRAAIRAMKKVASGSN